ncbi:hypothetical protein Bp8pC_186 [Bacillus phage Bp8p-C]|uniref:Uncharacterized protein n=2 Tax=Agatevirus Bp8pC TaxID=1910937 RepID=A0A0A0PUX1_9CAUD|nr:hypothetical protein AXJ20_gp162 [Bacillus phage Bp8p-C]YP_009784486.1 hypothetical protein QLX39_gp162 [Bacillus phage Bp8p-T]AHJ87616.1 hypothetical protein Bp8pC_186 [Bacillus phage Bp8p-C]AHJ87827.1 hypothetical protein Bp8pT_186 [Bacillus phage Bp8p-T]
MIQSNGRHYTETDREIMYQIASLFLKNIDEAFDHMYEINDQLKDEVEYTVHCNDATFFNSTFTTPYEAIQAIDHSQYDYDDYVMYHRNGDVTSFDLGKIPYLLESDMLDIVVLILHSVDKIDFNFKPDIAELIDQLSDAFPRRRN